MRTIRPYRLAGYVVVGSGVSPHIDSPTLFRDISEWTKWRTQFDDVALVELATERVEADEVILPIDAVEAAPFPWLLRRLWRLRARWLNLWRRRLNRIEAERQKRYFSPEAHEARVRASQ